ncbi:amidase domain-containing protein [Clostridium sp. DJ247]|uniref:amidase domain-containing protein n=1 Tax=Clostridium sp. DJ247 TaxID=2726188 RepID=UPI001A9B82B9|nr:amidase domain-containing protein [Clostridium sp. DJ247]MBC2578822.1 amidase domain-containing protein [Clostridium sp. DJ247]
MHSYLKYIKRLFTYTLLVACINIIPIIYNNKYENYSLQSSTNLFAEPYDKEGLKTEIENIYNKRSCTFITGDLESLKEYFDTSEKYGKWALEHEVKRLKYLNTWSKARGIKFTNIQSTVRIKKIYPTKETIKLALEETYKFDYIYPTDVDPVTNSFGVGIRHTLSLINKDTKLLIYNDEYTDCFEDALQAYSGEITGNLVSSETSQQIYNSKYVSAVSNQREIPKNRYYNREKAVEYADKYCGAAWGSGNDFKYNAKYKDFNGIGGDCTNYASQVLGDKEAGALPTDKTWRCEYLKYGNSQGSTAWINASELKRYLLNSGKGSVIKVGTFKDLTAATPDYSRGAVERLDLADLVCYEKKGQIDHFAVVTAYDSHGYPLVNSHTTDRYHVPWDLGWGDSRIRFFLIHVNG